MRPSKPHARRHLARLAAQIAALRAMDCTGDWRKASDKRRSLDRLEAEQMRWEAVLAPPVERWRMPF